MRSFTPKPRAGLWMAPVTSHKRAVRLSSQLSQSVKDGTPSSASSNTVHPFPVILVYLLVVLLCLFGSNLFAFVTEYSDFVFTGALIYSSRNPSSVLLLQLLSLTHSVLAVGDPPLSPRKSKLQTVAAVSATLVASAVASSSKSKGKKRKVDSDSDEEDEDKPPKKTGVYGFAASGKCEHCGMVDAKLTSQAFSKHRSRCGKNPQNRNVPCDRCEEVFDGFMARDNLGRHLKKVHGYTRPKASEKEKFDCEFCDMDLSDMNREKRTVHRGNCAENPKNRDMPCDYAEHGCTETFSGKNAQNRRIDHKTRCSYNPVQDFSCRYCKRTFSASAIQKHEKSCKVGGYPCKLCDLVFVRSDGLLTHTRFTCPNSAEAANNNHTCEVCGKTMRGNVVKNHWCDPRSSAREKVKEKAVAEALTKLGWTFSERQTHRIARDGDSAVIYPDFELLSHPLVQLPDDVRVFLEVDEFAHPGSTAAYTTIRESTRGRLLYESLGRSQSLIFIRFSPDGYTVNGKAAARIGIAERVVMLHQALKEANMEDMDSEYQAWYYFYSTVKGKVKVSLDKDFDSSTRDCITKIVAP